MTVLLHEAIDAVETIDVDALSDGQLHHLVIGLVEAQSRLDAARARVVAAWDGRRVWASDGSKAAKGRLARECNLSSAHAAVETARARRLQWMPATLAALSEGKLSIDQADVIGWANQPKLREQFLIAEPDLIANVQGLRLPEARRCIDYWIDAAYHALGLDRPYRQRDGRHFHLNRMFGGDVDVRGRLDPLAATEVLTEHHRIEQKLFEQDWTEARAEHGPNALPKDLPRTAAQRAADALQQMARDSAAYREGTHRLPRPLITILTGDASFARTCELADGTVIQPGQVVPYLLEGDIERIIFDSPSRVIDVGVRERFFTGALRRALEVRDRHCTHSSGCDVLAEDCQGDHKIPYSQGGLTTQDNGQMHCPKHNRDRNHEQTRTNTNDHHQMTTMASDATGTDHDDALAIARRRVTTCRAARSGSWAPRDGTSLRRCR